MINLIALIALQFLNTPYIYNGKNPLTGLDCSGLVSEILKGAGVISWNSNMNSQELYDYFKPQTQGTIIATGSLAFYGKDEKSIEHVALFINTHSVVEAGHGDSTITTLDLAKDRGAMVRVRPYNYRKDLVSVIRPNYEQVGFDL